MGQGALSNLNVKYALGAVESPYVAEHGVVYTRPWVVDLVLDLAGYDPDENLVDSVAVEPSCGDGSFLVHMVRRLSSSCQRQGRPLQDCNRSIVAFDLSLDAVTTSRERVASTLVDCGWNADRSRDMARHWVQEANFLLDPQLDMVGLAGGVDFVVGNPPYVRLEFMEPEIAETYRKRYKTMVGRADLYVGFFERALEMLGPGGTCAFICADRWMLNQYGSRLRKLITSGDFSVEAVVEMHGANAFQDEVLAYPAITTIRRAENQGKVLVAKVDRTSKVPASKLIEIAQSIRRGRRAAEELQTETLNSRGTGYAIVEDWFEGADPWPCISPERLKLLKRLEAEFSPLEDATTGTRVGIGLATGADKVFLTKVAGLVEEDRLLPMAMARDTMTGTLEWDGHYLINPWGADGSLVDLADYPRLQRYFGEHRAVLTERHVGKKNPSRWYKTIDKVNYALIRRPKLMIPDIKSVAHPVYEGGYYYPHHNLYHVTSEAWDLKVLGGILLSAVGQFFIECYAVRMSGGYLRFQAQYLRRIRVPRWDEVNEQQAEGLRQAFDNRDSRAATTIALELYDVDALPA